MRAGARPRAVGPSVALLALLGAAGAAGGADDAARVLSPVPPVVFHVRGGSGPPARRRGLLAGRGDADDVGNFRPVSSPPTSSPPSSPPAWTKAPYKRSPPSPPSPPPPPHGDADPYAGITKYQCTLSATNTVCPDVTFTVTNTGPGPLRVRLELDDRMGQMLALQGGVAATTNRDSSVPVCMMAACIATVPAATKDVPVQSLTLNVVVVEAEVPTGVYQGQLALWTSEGAEHCDAVYENEKEEAYLTGLFGNPKVTHPCRHAKVSVGLTRVVESGILLLPALQNLTLHVDEPAAASFTLLSVDEADYVDVEIGVAPHGWHNKSQAGAALITGAACHLLSYPASLGASYNRTKAEMEAEGLAALNVTFDADLTAASVAGLDGGRYVYPRKDLQRMTPEAIEVRFEAHGAMAGWGAKLIASDADRYGTRTEDWAFLGANDTRQYDAAVEAWAAAPTFRSMSAAKNQLGDFHRTSDAGLAFACNVPFAKPGGATTGQPGNTRNRETGYVMATLYPGRPSAATSYLEPQTATTGGDTMFVVRTRDRLGNECHRQWPGVLFKLEIARTGEGGEREVLLEVSPSAPYGSRDHVLSVPVLDLDAGAYNMTAFLDRNLGGAGGPDWEALAGDVALTVEAIRCEAAFMRVSPDGKACLCIPGAEPTDGGACGLCPAGTHKEAFDNSTCLPCPMGTTSAVGAEGAAECSCKIGTSPDGAGCSCSPGFYGNANLAGADPCTECPVGAFKAGVGNAAACTQCSNLLGGSASTRATGSTSEADCVCGLNYLREEVAGVAKCIDCPEGAACQGGNTTALLARPGYWRSSPNSAVFHQCAKPHGAELCVGGRAEGGTAAGGAAARSDSRCRAGHRGPLCWSCEDGYGKQLGVCERCSDTDDESRWVYVAFGLGLILVMVFVLLTGNLRRATSRRSEAAQGMNVKMSVVKIMVNWLQVTSLAGFIEVGFPKEIQALLQFEDASNISPWSFSSVNCAMNVDFFERFYYTALVPAVCFALALGVCALRKLVAWQAQWTFDIFVMLFEALLFLTYNLLTQSVLSVFKCRHLGDGIQVLVSEVSVECGTPDHKTAVRVGWVLFVVYCLGIPLQLGALLVRARPSLTETRSKVRLGFFFFNYRQKLFYYEVVNMARKLAMVATVVLLEHEIEVQIISLSLLSIVFLTLHTWLRPYESKTLNRLETFAYFVSTMQLTSAAYFHNRPARTGGAFSALLTFAVVSLSVTFILWSLYLIGFSSLRKLGARLHTFRMAQPGRGKGRSSLTVPPHRLSVERRDSPAAKPAAGAEYAGLGFFLDDDRPTAGPGTLNGGTMHNPLHSNV